jgi:hypothetical protein
MKTIRCHICDANLNKNEAALNKKLICRNIEKFKCLTCLADFIGCTKEDLMIKIEEFKEQGCTLFK